MLGDCWSWRGLIIVNKFNIVAWKEAAFALRVGTHPPVIVDHLNIGDVFALPKLDLVILGFFVVVLNKGSFAI